MSIKIIETLTLRRIDPVVILQRYLAGNYKNIDFPENKVIISSSTINLNKIGSDHHSEIYRFSDKTNTHQTIITTNQPQYQHSKNILENKPSKLPKILCMWCRRDLTTPPIGIPVSMEIKNETIYFHTEDAYDTFECAFASLKRLYSCNHIYKDPFYMDSEQMLNCMYKRMYPEETNKIQEAKDWRLLKSNGGPLSDTDYDNHSHKYITTNSIITLPVKRQYVKINLK